MLPILVILACIAIPICLYNYFEDKNKAIGNSLANKTQKITLDAIRAKKDYDKYLYEANIEKWKQSKFYCFVLKTIHDVAKDGESGVIINYLTEKNVILPTKTIYSNYREAITPSGHTVLFREIDYQFSPDELTHFSDTDALVTYIDGLIRYLKSERFNVKIRPSYTNSITISW